MLEHFFGQNYAKSKDKKMFDKMTRKETRKRDNKFAFNK